ncbi:MAG: hypothetical protein WKF84_28475 [Pyrinomonadaceae bacterium]
MSSEATRFPAGWNSRARTLEQFGAADIEELQEDAVIAAVHDQLAAGLDVITDGEQTRLDFNLSFYGFAEGIEVEAPGRVASARRLTTSEESIASRVSHAPRGLGVVAEWQRLRRLAPEGVVLKASVPGPFTLSGRLKPNAQYSDRYAITEALLPIVRDELENLIAAGCREITVDEPSMSCYAHREDPARFVRIFNHTVETVAGKCRLSTHLCFGNYKGRAVGRRRYASMFPAFLRMSVDEFHLEMASREFAELEIIGKSPEREKMWQ